MNITLIPMLHHHFETDLHRDVEWHDKLKMEYDDGFGLRR